MEQQEIRMCKDSVRIRNYRKRYEWAIEVFGDTAEELIKKIDKIDKKLKVKFREKHENDIPNKNT